jgi:replication factor C small subunit
MFEVDNSGLYVEKYRPHTFDNYIGNPDFITKCKQWIDNNEIPNILLYSHSPGTGKTTAAKILAQSIDSTILYLNCSDENSVDTVREKIKGFASTMAFTRWKVIICDECDMLTMQGQAAMRNLMETFSGTTRFILTCNYVEKIIEPIVSRCQPFEIIPPSKKDCAKHIALILKEEGISFNIEDIATIITASYPDMRRMLNTCQQQILNNTLTLDKQQLIETNYIAKIITILNDTTIEFKDKFSNIRQIIADSKVKNFTPLFEYLYDNIDTYAQGHIAGVILILAENQYMDSFVVDKEINIMAMFVKILNELNNK